MCLYVCELKMDEGKDSANTPAKCHLSRIRQAQVVPASGQGYKVPAIAELVNYSQNHIRAVIKKFNEYGLKALKPKPHSGRPKEFSEDDKALIAESAKCLRRYNIQLHAGRWHRSKQLMFSLQPLQNITFECGFISMAGRCRFHIFCYFGLGCGSTFAQQGKVLLVQPT